MGVYIYIYIYIKYETYLKDTFFICHGFDLYNNLQSNSIDIQFTSKNYFQMKNMKTTFFLLSSMSIAFNLNYTIQRGLCKCVFFFCVSVAAFRHTNIIINKILWNFTILLVSSNDSFFSIYICVWGVLTVLISSWTLPGRVKLGNRINIYLEVK